MKNLYEPYFSRISNASRNLKREISSFYLSTNIIVLDLVAEVFWGGVEEQ